MRRRTGARKDTGTSASASSSAWPVINPGSTMADDTGTCDNEPDNMQQTTFMANVATLFHLCCSPESFPVSFLHRSLAALGVPDDNLPSPLAMLRVVLLMVVVIMVVIFYHHQQQQLSSKTKSNKASLQQELQTARARVKSLERQLEQVNKNHHGNHHRQQEDNSAVQKRMLDDTNGDKEIRIFMDGAFDLLHYGHMNAFRLARSLGTHLIVGVNSDESITRCKGAPLMTDDERLSMVKTCKFVDEVVEDCPYVMSPEYLEWVIREYKVDYVVHGSDPCFTLDGQDVYASAKSAGKFREIPRTEGVSTSDILGRILVMTREHHIYDRKQIKSSTSSSSNEHGDDRDEDDDAEEEERNNAALLMGGQLKSKFLTTSLLLKLFSAGVKAPTKGMKVIYIDGTWDLFHPGHVAILKAARERGDYLIVGIHGDAVVNRLRGMNMPLMNLHERVLSVLGCRHVDDVLIDAPYEITPDMIARLNISEVVCGTRHDDIGVPYAANLYDYPKRAGILTVIESPSTFDLARVVQRIRKNQETFEAKFNRKMKAETDFYKQLHNRTSQ